MKKTTTRFVEIPSELEPYINRILALRSPVKQGMIVSLIQSARDIADFGEKVAARRENRP